jgi:hypothetical protein
MATRGDQGASPLKQTGCQKLLVLITRRPVYFPHCATLGWVDLPQSIGNAAPVTANGASHTVLACRFTCCGTKEVIKEQPCNPDKSFSHGKKGSTVYKVSVAQLQLQGKIFLAILTVQSLRHLPS